MDRRVERIELPQSTSESDGEGWLISYLDVLTLLITLFVLLVALTEMKPESVPVRQLSADIAVAEPAEPDEVAGTDAPDIKPVVPPLVTALDEPATEDQTPLFEGLEIDGVSVVETSQSVTLRIDDHLLFGSGDADLIVAGESVLQQLARALQTFEGHVSVEGHTDNLPIRTPRFPSNWELSSARAISVVRYLSLAGVETSRLRAVGYGDTRPLADNDSAEGRAANRRVELLIKL